MHSRSTKDFSVTFTYYCIIKLVFFTDVFDFYIPVIDIGNLIESLSEASPSVN